MLNKIIVNLNVLEFMNFFWQSIMDREKVSEVYLSELASLPEMKVLYDDEFNEESVRKVLSAISNRERLNTNILKEKQFWNNNMWVTEDGELLKAMIQPIKALNLDNLKDGINEKSNIPFEEIQVIFIPGFKEECYQIGNKLYINFFKIMVDVFYGTGKVTISNLEPEDFIEEKILAMKN